MIQRIDQPGSRKTEMESRKVGLAEIRDVAHGPVSHHALGRYLRKGSVQFREEVGNGRSGFQGAVSETPVSVGAHRERPVSLVFAMGHFPNRFFAMEIEAVPIGPLPKEVLELGEFDEGDAVFETGKRQVGANENSDRCVVDTRILQGFQSVAHAASIQAACLHFICGFHPLPSKVPDLTEVIGGIAISG